MDSREGHKIEEIILVFIIILNILDFFKVLPPWLDYVKKIISWIGLAYIVYKASPTRLLLGDKHHKIDIILIASFFSMIVKNLVSFAIVARNEMISNLGKIMSYVNIASIDPSMVSGGTIPITLQQEAFNGLKLLGTLNNPAELIAPFVTKITMFNPQVFFEFISNGEKQFMALQPWGLDGVILQFYNTLAANAVMINKISLIIGLFGLLLIALYTSFTGVVSKKSVLGALGAKEGRAKGITILKRFVMVSIIYCAFFIIIFNLFMEWFAIAVDAPLLMMGLIGYILFFIKYATRRRKKLAEEELHVDDFVEKISGFGLDFYDKFVNLFKKRNTILLGLTGILVLHLLTDIANYLLPYLMGVRDALYLERFSYGHHSLGYYLTLNPGTYFESFKLLIIYLSNVLGVFFLLSLPAYVWYKMLISKEHVGKKEHPGQPKLKPWTTFFAYFGIIIFLLAPAFKFKGLNANSGIVGVDILTKEATSLFSFLNLELIIMIAFVIALLVAIINYKGYWHITILPLIIASITSLGIYAYNFFMSSFYYYLNTAINQLSSLSFSGFILGMFLALFLIIDSLFYIIAFFSSIYEMLRD